VVSRATRRRCAPGTSGTAASIFLFSIPTAVVCPPPDADKISFPPTGMSRLRRGRAGESYDTAAQRELREELGVCAAASAAALPVRYEDTANRVSGMVYSCTSDGPFTLQASEIAEGEWMDLDVVIERTQQRPFCPTASSLRLYLSKLDAVLTAQRHRDAGRPIS